MGVTISLSFPVLLPSHNTLTLTHSPEHSWVILLLKDASLASDDNTIALHLLLHVGRIAGSVVREQEGAVCHPVYLHLQQRTIHDQCVDCQLDPGYLQGGGGGMRRKRGGRREGAQDTAMEDTVLCTFKEYFTPSEMSSTSTTLESISAFITCPLKKGRKDGERRRRRRKRNVDSVLVSSPWKWSHQVTHAPFQQYLVVCKPLPKRLLRNAQ